MALVGNHRSMTQKIIGKTQQQLRRVFLCANCWSAGARNAVNQTSDMTCVACAAESCPTCACLLISTMTSFNSPLVLTGLHSRNTDVVNAQSATHKTTRTFGSSLLCRSKSAHELQRNKLFLTYIDTKKCRSLHCCIPGVWQPTFDSLFVLHADAVHAKPI